MRGRPRQPSRPRRRRGPLPGPERRQRRHRLYRGHRGPLWGRAGGRGGRADDPGVGAGGRGRARGAAGGRGQELSRCEASPQTPPPLPSPSLSLRAATGEPPPKKRREVPLCMRGCVCAWGDISFAASAWGERGGGKLRAPSRTFSRATFFFFFFFFFFIVFFCRPGRGGKLGRVRGLAAGSPGCWGQRGKGTACSARRWGRFKGPRFGLLTFEGLFFLAEGLFIQMALASRKPLRFSTSRVILKLRLNNTKIPSALFYYLTPTAMGDGACV